MTLFILPTSGPRNYRGKYPARVRSVSYARFAGLHVELNDGTRLWTMHPAALPHVDAPGLPRVGTGFEVCSGQAVQMTPEQYAVLTAAADLRRGVTGTLSGSPEAEQSRAMLLQVVPADPEGEAAARAESCLILADELPAAPEARRDNVEWYAGRDAYGAGVALAACPYAPDGERAARWALGWREAQASAGPSWAGMVPAYQALIQGGNVAAFWPELETMARLADERNRMAPALLALATIANEVAHAAGEPGTMARDELDSAIAAAFALTAR